MKTKLSKATNAMTWLPRIAVCHGNPDPKRTSSVLLVDRAEPAQPRTVSSLSPPAAASVKIRIVSRPSIDQSALHCSASLLLLLQQFH